jgi:hypothetical protein
LSKWKLKNLMLFGGITPFSATSFVHPVSPGSWAIGSAGRDKQRMLLLKARLPQPREIAPPQSISTSNPVQRMIQYSNIYIIQYMYICNIIYVYIYVIYNIYIYYKMYASCLPSRVSHSTKITQINMIKDCWPYTDILKYVRQAMFDSIWYMNMSKSTIHRKNAVQNEVFTIWTLSNIVRFPGTTMSLSWKHISKIDIYPHLSITMSAKWRITKKKTRITTW